MVSDSLLAFKTSILYILGTYILMLMQFYQQEPRPYWVHNDLSVVDNICALSYASPSYHIFNVQFITAYYIYNKFYKYSDSPSMVLIYVSYGLLFGLSLAVGFSQIFLAQLYAYEIIQTTLVTMIYMMILLQFDKEIMQLSEEIGFQKKTSRSYKFYLLFGIMSLFIFAAILISGMKDVWVNKKDWMMNII